LPVSPIGEVISGAWSWEATEVYADVTR